ncbi:MAG: T9SS type A sorting domain-containing protein, partial [Eudoraea sp.]|nr:T9SS type A sorting domain-containing protein [Eudoraea sp.]
LDVSGLPKGLYFLQITTAEGGVTRKLLVQ